MLTGDRIDYGNTAIFVGRQFIITVRHGSDRTHSPVRAQLEATPWLLKHGPDYVLHAILDFIVDGYFPVLDTLEEKVLAMEDHAIDTFLNRAETARLFTVRRELFKLERILGTMEDLSNQFLNLHLPQVERRPALSNAEGARLASLDPSLAAIASTRAGSEYGLHLVAPAIQDDVHNRTRFAIVTHPDRHPAPKPSGHDCTSLVVSVKNQPGAVHDMLVPLKTHGVSMTRFESRPARSGQWEYYFYIDIEGHPDEPHVGLALRALRDACAFFKVLGTYPIDVH